MKLYLRRYNHILQKLLIIFEFIIGVHFCVALLALYRLDWYSLFFENGVAARLYTGSFILVLFCIFCFPYMRYIGAASGLFGVILTTIKLNAAPLPEIVEGSEQWPGPDDVHALRLLCGVMVVLAMLCPALFFWIKKRVARSRG